MKLFFLLLARYYQEVPPWELECLLQYYQPVSVPPGHGQNRWFLHLPSLNLSTGHFYLARSGHYHVAPTLRDSGLDILQ
jgi:hypothetical protein